MWVTAFLSLIYFKPAFQAFLGISRARAVVSHAPLIFAYQRRKHSLAFRKVSLK